jgi:hypothetical protein
MQERTVACVDQGESASRRRETNSDAISEKSGEGPAKPCDDACSLDQRKPQAQDSSAVLPGADGWGGALQDAPAISHDRDGWTTVDESILLPTGSQIGISAHPTPITDLAGFEMARELNSSRFGIVRLL